MKKFNKIMTVLVLVVAVFAFVSPAFASDIKYNANIGEGQATSTLGVNMVNRVWSIVITVLRVAAIGAVVFAGVRYMFASADQKADIKKSLGILAIGAILVFGASFVIEFIIKLTKDIAEGTGGV